MIRFEHVGVTHRTADGPVHALADLDLEVARGETVALIGASGAGKTTALRLVNRLEEPTSGRVLVDGRDVATADPVTLRRGIGYVVQEGGLFPHLTVAANVALVAKLVGWSRARRDARVDELLELVRLDPRLHRDRYPAELSGGQRQRVGVARALTLDPAVLLMDEPFGALDPVTRSELQGEFLELARTVGKTTLIVSHDLEEAFLLGDKVALLEGGRLLQLGTREELFERPASDAVRAFLDRERVAGA